VAPSERRGAVTGTSTSFTVDPGSAASFTASASSPQTAGVAFNVSLSALDGWDNSATGYSGVKTIDFSGPHSSPNSTAPAYPASVTFTSGSGTASVTLFDAETTTITAADHTTPSINGTTGSILVNPGSAASFVATGPGSATAGSSFSVSLTAKDSWANTATGYAGSMALDYSGPSNSPNSTPPTYQSPVTFTAGAGTASVTLVDAQTTTITVKDHTTPSISGTTGSIVVGPAALDSFTVSPNSGTQTAGSSFNETLTAFDHYGNQKTDYTGTVTTTSNDGNASLPSAYTFTGGDNGQHVFSVTLKTAGSGKTVTFTDGSVSATGTFTVNPGALDHFTLSPNSGTQTQETAFNETLTAFDAYGNQKTNYAGTVTTTSNDPSATLPSPYTFTVGDGGQHVFSVTLNTAGSGKTVTFTDGSVSVTGTFTVNSSLFLVTNLVMANGGTSSIGQVSAGDTFTITFNRAVNPSTICSNWTSGGGTQTRTLVQWTVKKVGSDDQFFYSGGTGACGTFHGPTSSLPIQLTQAGYEGGTKNWPTSSMTYDATAHTLTVTLGGTAVGTGSSVAASTPTWPSPDTGIKDTNGNALANQSYSGTGSSF
jgi:hypothetical protein